MADMPIEDQPPLLLKVKSASCPLARGERTHNGMIMANNPMTWMVKTMPSTAGSFFAKKVLKMMQKAAIAQASKVPCHL